LLTCEQHKSYEVKNYINYCSTVKNLQKQTVKKI
jgi:hypothetical protein